MIFKSCITSTKRTEYNVYILSEITIVYDFCRSLICERSSFSILLIILCFQDSLAWKFLKYVSSFSLQKGGALFNTAMTKATPAVRTAYKFVSFLLIFKNSINKIIHFPSWQTCTSRILLIFSLKKKKL